MEARIDSHHLLHVPNIGRCDRRPGATDQALLPLCIDIVKSLHVGFDRHTRVHASKLHPCRADTHADPHELGGARLQVDGDRVLERVVRGRAGTVQLRTWDDGSVLGVVAHGRPARRGLWTSACTSHSCHGTIVIFANGPTVLVAFRIILFIF